MTAATRATAFGASLRAIRAAVGVSQRELARRVSRSQAYVSAVENGLGSALRVSDAEKLCAALGATLVFGVEAPLLLGAPRQRDFVHAHCVSHVCRRLDRAGWLVEREVEIGEPRRPGWIDVLAFRPVSGALLVIEVKTAISDLGALERQIGWYEREALAAGGRLGWRASSVTAAVFLLSTETNDAILRRNRAAFISAFPGLARELLALVDGRTSRGGPRTLAAIEPQSKARRWCRATVIQGRRSPAAYLHYADAVRAMTPAARRRTRHDQAR